MLNKKYSFISSSFTFRWYPQKALRGQPCQIQVDVVSDFPEPALTTSLKMVSELEEFCENEAHSTVAHSYVEVILFCTWTSMCLSQADTKGVHHMNPHRCV